MEKRSNRRRLDLLSRHAIFQMKEFIGGSSAPPLDDK
jgi:hypothetical protein